MKKIIFILFLWPFVVDGQIITTIAGNGSAGYSGDSELAMIAELNTPADIKFDKKGNIFFSDGANSVIRRVNTFGIISTIAGTGATGYNGDNISAITAKLSQPLGLVIDDTGNIYFAEWHGARIRKIDTFGIITTIAGNGTFGYNGDNILAITAQINYPYSIAIDKNGNLFFSDEANFRVRKINRAGIITTIAGTGIAGYSGDGGLAISAKIRPVGFMAFDSIGNLFIADGRNYVIRKIDTFGIITTIAGTGISGYSGDGGLAMSATFKEPNGITFDHVGNSYICDDLTYTIRKIDKSGIITTIAGNGSSGFGGDGGLATLAEFNWPNGIAIDANDNLYVVDVNNNRIRKITFNVGVTNIENPQNNISIYPNPTTSQINITATTKIESIVITNTLGQIIYIPPAHKGVHTFGNTMQIDVKNFPASVYFVKVNGIYSTKFVKE